MQPFLKWAGGKRWLVTRLVQALPSFNTYYEPFVGSGALFFALEPKDAVLGDTNPELINCYRGIRDQCGKIIRILKGLPTTKEFYYRLRDKIYPAADPTRRAAYFIYLNKMCWNGLYRVNRDGKFNVPIGSRRGEAQVLDEETLLAAEKLLRRKKIVCGDFLSTISNAKRGDLVYFDPPYITTHMNNGFIKYNSKLFHVSDERRLARTAFELVLKGVHVIVSNAAHPQIKEQYDGPFEKLEIDRASLIAGDASKRTRFKELLITSFEFGQQ